MSLPDFIRDSAEIDFDAMDSAAQRLAERFKGAGMSPMLADQLVTCFGAQAFCDVAQGSAMNIPPDVVDGWKQTAFRIWEASSPRLSTGAFLMAAGWMPHGITSQRDLAKYFRVSPEHVSNLVEDWQRAIGLPRTAHQKSAKAVDAAKLHHKKNHKHHVPKE